MSVVPLSRVRASHTCVAVDAREVYDAVLCPDDCVFIDHPEVNPIHEFEQPSVPPLLGAHGEVRNLLSITEIVRQEHA